MHKEKASVEENECHHVMLKDQDQGEIDGFVNRGGQIAKSFREAKDSMARIGLSRIV